MGWIPAPEASPTCPLDGLALELRHKKKKKTRDEDDIETPSGNAQDWLGLEACTIFFCRIHRRLFSSSSSTELSLGAPMSKSIQLKKEIGISWIKVERSPPIFQITRTQFLLFLDHNVF